MKTYSNPLSVLTTIPFLLLAMTACSSAGGTPSPDAGPSVDSGPDAAPVVDAAIDAPREDAAVDAGACSDLAVPVTTLTSGCPDPQAPPPTGGTLVDGTYTLIQLLNWSSGCGGYTTTLSEALRVHGGTIELATDVKSKAVEVGGTGTRKSAFAVTSQGDPKSLTLTPICSAPVDAGGVEQTLGAGVYGYSATATELRFFTSGAGGPQLIALYTRPAP
jgi:hypothetical protein